MRRTLGIAFSVTVATAALVAAVATTRASDWHPVGLLVLLGVVSVTSDQLTIEARGQRLSGSLLALVLIMTFLGPLPAILVGLLTMSIDAARTRPAARWGVIANLASYTVFPLAGGLLARAASDHGVGTSGLAFVVVVLAVYLVSLLLNFGCIAVQVWFHTGRSIGRQVRTILGPVLPSECAAAILVAMFAFAYSTSGLLALSVLVLALFAFQVLTRALLVSQERAEQLAARSTELASLQVGVLAALVQTLSLRDKMTARHSAAVARYARAIAKAVGCSEAEQELVHTAGLLHDIGKFIFPDRILLADSRLSEEDWDIVKRHPAQGARVVGRVAGYGPVAEIILAHHERLDGLGYPRGLAGEDIPRLSRMISVADTYDVMTARDSYRDPVSPAEAIAELRRVSGTQLDGELVESFITILEERGVSFTHTTDADFERELDFEARVASFLQVPVAS